MVGVATLCPGDPGSNPSWSAAQIQIDIEFTQIIQAYDQATPIVITVTLSSLVGIDILSLFVVLYIHFHF